MVVIPVDEGQVIRKLGLLFRCNGGTVAVVIHQRCMIPEKHIIPDHRLQTVFFAQATCGLQVLHNDFPVRAVTLMPQVPTGAQANSLIHAEVDPATAESFAEMGDHGFHQRNGAVLSYHQIVHRIAYRLHVLPANGRAQVCQRLDTGNQFNTQSIRKIVQFFLLCNRISAPAVTEVRVSRQLVGILHIEVGGVKAHQCQLAQKPLHGFYRIDTVAGQIDHGRKTGETGCQRFLLYLRYGQCSAQKAQGIADGISPERQMVSLPHPAEAVVIAGKPGDRKLRKLPIQRCMGVQQLQSML